MNSSACPSKTPSTSAPHVRAEAASETTGLATGNFPAIESAALLQGARAIHILHNGETYRLQTTRQGKLILTK